MKGIFKRYIIRRKQLIELYSYEASGNTISREVFKLLSQSNNGHRVELLIKKCEKLSLFLIDDIKLNNMNLSQETIIKIQSLKISNLNDCLSIAELLKAIFKERKSSVKVNPFNIPVFVFGKPLFFLEALVGGTIFYILFYLFL